MKTALGVAIKIERSALSVSQERLAERAGLHRTYVSDVERGVRNPSFERARILNGDLAECRRLGAKAYLVKALHFEQFHEVTAKLRLAWKLVKPTRTETPKSKRAWKDQGAEIRM